MADPTSVIDASALLAYLKDEPGSEAVELALVRGAVMSAANLAEVLSKLVEIGEDPKHAMDEFRRRGFIGQTLEILSLGDDDAYAIAALRKKSQSLGLSLGDRACLALAIRLELPVLTADRSWSALRLAIKIETIR